jgi:ArsR family transcriptional regulator
MPRTHLVDARRTQRAYELLFAVTHPTRHKILAFLQTNGRTNVLGIYESLDLDQSVTSQHLRTLKDLHLVSTERSGKFIYYTVNKAILDGLYQATSQYEDRVAMNLIRKERESGDPQQENA